MTIQYWGISPAVVMDRFNTRVTYTNGGNTVKIGYLSLENLKSDCGSVTLHHIGEATKGNLEDAIEFCRLSGYSLLVGTVVYKSDAAKVESLGFKVKELGPSHRNPRRPHYLVYYHIPESKFEVFGYQITRA